jgi:hypothetical protein
MVRFRKFAEGFGGPFFNHPRFSHVVLATILSILMIGGASAL